MSETAPISDEGLRMIATGMVGIDDETLIAAIASELLARRQKKRTKK